MRGIDSGSGNGKCGFVLPFILLGLLSKVRGGAGVIGDPIGCLASVSVSNNVFDETFSQIVPSKAPSSTFFKYSPGTLPLG